MKNVAVLKLIRSFLAVLNGILITGFIVRNLSDDIASEWFYIINLSAIFLLMDMGIPNAVSRLNSTNHSLKNEIKAYQVTQKSIFILLILSLVFLLIIGLLTFLNFIKIKYLTTIFVIAIGSTAILIVLKIYDGILTSKLQFTENVACDLVGGFVRLISVSVFHLLPTFNFTVFAILYFLSFILASFCKVMLSGKNFSKTIKSDMAVVKDIYDVSYASFLLSLSNLIVRQLLVFIAYYFLTADQYILLSITFLFYLNMYQAQTIFLSMVGPKAAYERGTGTTSKMHFEMQKFDQATGIMCIIIAVGLCTFTYPILRYFYLLDQLPSVSIVILMLAGNFLFYLTRDVFIYRSALNYLSYHWLVSKTEMTISFLSCLICVTYLNFAYNVDYLIFASIAILGPLIFRCFSNYKSKYFHVIKSQ